MIHELRILSSFVRPILGGSKTFEIRENDRGLKNGFVVFGIREEESEGI